MLMLDLCQLHSSCVFFDAHSIYQLKPLILNRREADKLCLH